MFDHRANTPILIFLFLLIVISVIRTTRPCVTRDSLFNRSYIWFCDLPCGIYPNPQLFLPSDFQSCLPSLYRLLAYLSRDFTFDIRKLQISHNESNKFEKQHILLINTARHEVVGFGQHPPVYARRLFASIFISVARIYTISVPLAIP